MKHEMTKPGVLWVYTMVWAAHDQMYTDVPKKQDTMSVVWVCIPDLAAPFMCYMTYGQVTFFFLRAYYLFI